MWHTSDESMFGTWHPRLNQTLPDDRSILFQYVSYDTDSHGFRCR